MIKTNFFEKAMAKGSDLANTVLEKGNDLTSTAIDLATKQTTQSTSDSMDERRIGADNLLDTVTTKHGKISQSNNLKGFIFEEEQARTFNESAADQGSSLRAIVDPPGGVDGKGAPDIRIIDMDTGEIVKSYQAKIGEERYIDNQLMEEKYYDGRTDAFVVDSENSYNQAEKEMESLSNAADNIDFNNPQSIDEFLKFNPREGVLEVDSIISSDGIESDSFSHEEMETIAENPENYIQELQNSANTEEVKDGIEDGATIAIIYQALHESIKILARVNRGEKLQQDVVVSALKDVMVAATSGALRGALIKVVKIILEKEMEDSGALPLVIVSVAPIVYKTLFKYLQGKITFEECIKEVGSESLSRAMVVTMGLIFPPLGFTLMGVSVLTTIWKEFDLGNQIRSSYPEAEQIFELTREAEIKKIALINLGKEQLSQAKETTEKAIGTAKESTGKVIGTAKETTGKVMSTAKEKVEETGKNLKNSYSSTVNYASNRLNKSSLKNVPIKESE